MPDDVIRDFEYEVATLFDEIVAWADRRVEDYPDSEHVQARCAYLRNKAHEWKREVARLDLI